MFEEKKGWRELNIRDEEKWGKVFEEKEIKNEIERLWIDRKKMDNFSEKKNVCRFLRCDICMFYFLGFWGMWCMVFIVGVVCFFWWDFFVYFCKLRKCMFIIIILFVK